MSLLNYVRSTTVELPVGIIPYFEYDFNNISEDANKIKSISLKVASFPFTMETHKISTKINPYSQNDMNSLGLNLKKITLQAMQNDMKMSEETRVFNLMKELGSQHNPPKKKTNIDKFLKWAFNYEKIRNEKNLIRYLASVSNMILEKTRLGRPSFIIISPYLVQHILDMKTFTYNQQKEGLVKNSKFNVLGNIAELNLDVLTSVDLKKGEIIFGSKVDETQPGIHFIQMKIDRNLHETFGIQHVIKDIPIELSETEGVILTSHDEIYFYKRNALIAIPNANKGFWTDEIILEKRTFWTFIWDKIKKKLWPKKNLLKWLTSTKQTGQKGKSSMIPNISR